MNPKLARFIILALCLLVMLALLTLIAFGVRFYLLNREPLEMQVTVV